MSLWFIPGLFAIIATTLALLSTWADREIGDAWIRRAPLVFAGTPEGARAVLSTIATSMVTIAGVVFSMTIVSLQLASSQFGPRLLRTFLRDRGNQAVLGVFVGVFLFCVLVLPSVDASAQDSFVPHIAVTLAIVWAVAGLASLVYYIDHVAQSIHADAIIEAVGREIDQAVQTPFPGGIGEDAGDAKPPDFGRGVTIESGRAGHIRYVDGAALLRIASQHDLVIRLIKLPGDHVIPDEALVAVREDGDFDEIVRDQIESAYTLGAHRTTLQDVGFAFEQLTEMGVRALSPGINDPTTAMHCIDRICVGLAAMVARSKPSPVRRDAEGQVRLVAAPVEMSTLLSRVIEPIARGAGHHLDVHLRLLGKLEPVCARAARPEDAEALRRQGGQIVSRAREQAASDADKDRLKQAGAWVEESR